MGCLRQLFQEKGFTQNVTTGNPGDMYKSSPGGRGEDSSGQCRAHDGEIDDTSPEMEGATPAPATGSDRAVMRREQEGKQQRKTPQTAQVWRASQ